METILCQHPAVCEAAVIGAPSARWGETPVGFVTIASGQKMSGQVLKDWAKARLGKMQRLADVCILEKLPRSAIGKILNRELQQLCAAEPVG